jgi:class 3 adenylate cyclase
LRNLQGYQLLTFAESERRLDELLHVKISEATKPVGLDELAQRKASPNEKIALNQLGHDLLSFVAEANPVLRPIAREYQEIVALLARGKRKRIAKRLSRLEVTRKQLAARMSDIDDYMNWFEATQMKSGSGNFTDYLKAVDQSQLSVPKRHDPLSVYVDALEDQFDN